MNKICTAIITLIAGFIFSGNATYAAGFDCSAASKIAEKVICGSQELSTLDKRINKHYLQELSKPYVDVKALKQAQRKWLKERDQCEYSFDCIKQKSLKRIISFEGKQSSIYAFSWGGILREEPNLSSSQVGSTHERQEITVISETDIKMNSYPWFYIEANGVKAYQWGGILCDKSRPNKTYCSE